MNRDFIGTFMTTHTQTVFNSCYPHGFEVEETLNYGLMHGLIINTSLHGAFTTKTIIPGENGQLEHSAD